MAGDMKIAVGICVLVFLSVALSQEADEENSILRPQKARIRRLFVKQLTTFSSDLYKALVKGEDGSRNVVVSPYSVTNALLLTLMGSRNNTRLELRAGMRMGLIRNLKDVFGSYRDQINQLSRRYTFKSANRLYHQQGRLISHDYLDLARRDSGALPREVDFGDSERARSTINAWVEEVTEGTIPSLIPSAAISPAVRLVIVNALYLKARWNRTFDVARTREEPFYLKDGGQVNVHMMKVDEYFLNAKIDKKKNYRAVEIPYQDGKMSMVLVVPDRDPEDGIDFDEMERNVLADLPDVTADMQRTEMFISLPRFKFGYNADLKAALQKLGIRDLFIEGKANLTYMDRSGQLFVSDVFHKAFVEVNEEGTEASAATAVINLGRSMTYDTQMEFVANQPFIFFIKDSIGTIYFVGRVMNPSHE